MKIRLGWKGVRYKGRGGGQEVTKVFNTKIDINYINPLYEIEIISPNTTNDQGLLLLGTIKPKLVNLPEFSLRWDEKDNHLNVDISPKETHWLNETNGFRGHTPVKSSSHPGRAFLLIVEMPSLKVIDAVITFNLARGVQSSTSVGISATVTATHTKNKQLKNILCKLRDTH